MDEKFYYIPFSHVNYTCRNDLSNKLDPVCPPHGYNWKMVAEKLGFNIDEIESIEAQNIDRNTMVLISAYSKMKGNSVGKFYDALKKIKRRDAYEILEKAIPDIWNSYEQERTGHHISSAVEHSECPNPQARTSCPRCNTSFSCNDFSTRCNNTSLHRCIPHCEPLQSGYQHHQCPTTVSENHTSHRLSCCNCDNMTNVQPHKGQLPLKMNIPACHTGMTHLSTVSPKTEMSSMSVNFNSLNYQDTENMEVCHGGYEAPVPLHHGLLRQQMSTVEMPYLRNAQDSTWIVGAEEEVTTSEEMAPDSDPEYSFDSTKLKRQVSDENNYNQPLAGHHMNMANCPMTTPIKSSPPVTSSEQPLQHLKYLANESETFLPKKPYHHYIKNARNSIEQEDRMKMLNRRIKCEPKEAPDSSCTWQHSNYNSHEPAGSGFFMRNSEQQSSDRITVRQHSSSLPRERVKNYSTGTTPIESVSDNKTLCKSSSLPDNMKLSEYKKKTAYKDIFIFVTYSCDSEIHVKNVIGLCNCIGKNGFSCCMDIFDRKLDMPDNKKERWYKELFYKADFVLVCVSAMYEADITRPANPINGHSADVLHTKPIYQLMYDQYQRNGFKMPRFVPLLFKESDEQFIPHWLKDTYKYYWPKQWKDLLWMLTKPEERLKPLPKSRNKHSYS